MCLQQNYNTMPSAVSDTLSKKLIQNLSSNINLLWRLFLNLPSLSLRNVTALPLSPPLQSLHLLSWFLPVAMPAVVRTPQKGKTSHTGPNTYQKQTIPADIFKINQYFIISPPCLIDYMDSVLLK